MFIKLHRKAQAILEYSCVIIAGIIVVAAMSPYALRAVNANLKRSALGLNEVFSDINNGVSIDGIDDDDSGGGDDDEFDPMEDLSWWVKLILEVLLWIWELIGKLIFGEYDIDL